MSDSAQIILALVGGANALFLAGQKLADWLRTRALDTPLRRVYPCADLARLRLTG